MSLSDCLGKLNSGKVKLFNDADVAEIMSVARRQKGALEARQSAAVQSLLDEAIAERAEITALIAAELPPVEPVAKTEEAGVKAELKDEAKAAQVGEKPTEAKPSVAAKPPGSDGKFNEQKPGAKPDQYDGLSLEQTQTLVVDTVHKLLGKDMGVKIAGDIFGKSGAKISGDWEKGVIRVALNAYDPLSVAFHESMHELISRMMESGHEKSVKVLQNMADSPALIRKLEIAFAGEQGVLDAIKNDPEERIAYAFQLWAAKKLQVGPDTENLFQKIFAAIRKALGLMSNDAKAVELMHQFIGGHMADRGAMARILDTQEARGAYVAAVGKKIKPVMDRGAEIVGYAESALTESDNPALDWIGRQFNNKTGKQGEEQGYLSAKEQMHGKFDNKFAAALRGLSKDEIDLVLEGLQKKEWHADPVLNKAQKDIAKVFAEMYEYGAEAKLSRLDPTTGEWVKMGKNDDYRLPVSWDASALIKYAAEFKAEMLEHHSEALEAIAVQANAEVAAGKHAGEYTASWEKLYNKDTGPITKEDVLDAIHNRMVRTNGQVEVEESQSQLGFSPFMKAINSRTLWWIDQKHFAKYQEKDIAKILTTYVDQMTSRAEYSRRFGAGGEIMRQKMDVAYSFETARVMKEDPKLTKEAAEELAMKNLAPAQRAIMAIEGTLGNDISPTLRSVSSYAVVYQNLHLLGFSLFTSLIDPLGIVVNGGEVKDAYATLKRGFADVAKEWGKLTGLRKETAETLAKDRDEATLVAEMIGTVDSGMFMSTIGNTYGSQFLSNRARNFNDKFFRWNGMEPFTRAMRIGATQAAISFIKRHHTKPNEHSERYFKELGLDPSKIEIDADGRLNVENIAIQRAVMRWVDGAILRPNAAMRPTYASDPHYAIFYHMKQFMYAMHAVITKRIMIELKNGNMNPAVLAFAGYLPVMLAADTAKGLLIQSVGGTTPHWQHEDVSGVIAHGLQRTGVFIGPWQMAVDMPEYGVASALGPTVEQTLSAVTDPIGETIREAIAVGPMNFNMAASADNITMLKAE